MGLLTGLFRTVRKKLSLTHDTDMGTFRDKLKVLVEEKDKLSDEDVESRVTELMTMTEDLPESDSKEELKRYLEDFKLVKGQDAEVARVAGEKVAELFEKLDKEAMVDMGEGAPADADPEPEGGEEIKKEEVKEEEKREEKITDADPDPEYTMEEIYQFIKKRKKEDKDWDGDSEELEVESETETGDGCSTQDHGMPEIPMNRQPAIAGGLDDLMKTMKGEKNGL